MSDIQIILITVGSILLTMGLLWLNNNRKTKRGFQFPFLILCPVAMLTEAVLLIVFRMQIIQWLNQYPWVSQIYQTIMSNAGSLFGMELLALNVVFALPYTILKLILRPPLTAFMHRREHMRVAKAYEWDENFQNWYLKENRVGLRSLLQGTLWVTAFITALICGGGWIAGPGSDYWFYAFPGAALVVLMEFQAYYCGVTREEYAHSIGGDDVASSVRGQYNKLKQIYESLFPESLVSSRTGKDFQSRSNAGQLLRKLSESSNRIDRFVGEYYLHLPHRKPSDFDVDLIDASNKLLQGQSTIIFNPFYRDMSDYITLPIVNTLLNGKNLLVIIGRQSMKNNIAQWLRDILANYCRTDRLWKVSFLEDLTDVCDVGILSFSDLYKLKVINGSEAFFKKIGFVLLIEPSKMLTTSQTGLSIVVGKFNKAEQPAFCAFDHESDGLLDLLSHIFQQNVTSVISAPPVQPTYTAMGWNASGNYKRQSLFQQQTHFLGNGTELAAVALKYQVPHVCWYSEEKAPVLDIHWIAEQYYAQIARYARLPYEQMSIDERITFSSDLWESPIKDHSFLIAEDETCNLFATLRAFLSRGKEQSFVHVFSENYLLRDYMRYNWQLFMSDPKAIPMLSPHYAKTERNTVMRLVILMASGPVSQKHIEQELQLLGYDDTKECYKELSSLISKYFGIKDTIITIKNHVESTDTLPVTIQMYSIPKRLFDLHFSNTLKTAFFVVEDEKLGSQYIDARMFDHIQQLVMPGQQIVYGGKLYKVHTLTPQVGCILHRAADEYMKRLYYRQIRTYVLEKKENSDTTNSSINHRKEGVISNRRIGKIEVVVENRSFSVSSTGYLEMQDQGNLRTARVVDLSKDPRIHSDDPGSQPYKRSYKHKAVLSLRLPGTDTNVRFTLCLLLSELMHTLFPYSWHYIAVLCKKPEIEDDKLKMFTYEITGAAEDDLIYFLEDSNMDLGLIEAIDNNLFRILEIVTDYLNWHVEKLTEPLPRDPETIRPTIPNNKLDERIPNHKKRPGLFSRIWNTIFRKRKKKGKPGVEGKEPENSPSKQPETPLEEAQSAECVENANFIGKNKAQTDYEMQLLKSSSSYAQNCFLKFGLDETDQILSIEQLRAYLNFLDLGDNSLLEARKGPDAHINSLEMDTECFCDFCGKPLSGVSYERLSDGRIRCQSCASSAINSVDEFKEVFNSTLQLIEENYRIVYNVSIGIKVTDAKSIGRLSGRVFVPTSGYDGRVVGLAQRKRNRYTLFVENGSPRLATVATTAHEMTHIWQYINWNRRKIKSLYKTKMERDIVYEGMASWTEIQTLYMIGEQAYAQEQEQILLHRAKDPNDIYGVGFVLYCEKYGLNRQGDIPIRTPFNTFPPL